MQWNCVIKLQDKITLAGERERERKRRERERAREREREKRSEREREGNFVLAAEVPNH